MITSSLRGRPGVAAGVAGRAAGLVAGAGLAVLAGGPELVQAASSQPAAAAPAAVLRVAG
jgi:hypothetical protein